MRGSARNEEGETDGTTTFVMDQELPGPAVKVTKPAANRLFVMVYDNSHQSLPPGTFSPITHPLLGLHWSSGFSGSLGSAFSIGFLGSIWSRIAAL